MRRRIQQAPLVELKGEDNKLDYIPLVWAQLFHVEFSLRNLWPDDRGSDRYRQHCRAQAVIGRPAIAYKFFELLEEAGLPAGVVNFMTGSGQKSAMSWSIIRRPASLLSRDRKKSACG